MRQEPQESSERARPDEHDVCRDRDRQRRRHDTHEWLHTKTSPAAAYRKTNGHDLDGSCSALEEAMAACATTSRATHLEQHWRRPGTLCRNCSGPKRSSRRRSTPVKTAIREKSLLDRCEKLEQAIEHASLELKDAVQGACVKRREAGDEAYAFSTIRRRVCRGYTPLRWASRRTTSHRYLGKARSASQLKDWQACITDARKAASLDVQSSEAHSLLVTALLETNDPQQAAQALGNAPDDVLESSEELQALGTETIPEAAKHQPMLFPAKKFQEALALYTLAVELTDGQRHVYLSNRSACLQALSRWDRAADDARRVIELKPDFAKGHLHLARSLVRLDRKLEACEVLEEGIEDGAISASRGLSEIMRHLHECASIRERSRLDIYHTQVPRTSRH